MMNPASWWSGAIIWTAIGRLIGGLGGVLSIPLLIRALTPHEQGLHYIFASLLAAQVLLELGFSTVAIQSISHARHSDTGRHEYAGFFLLTLRWYAAVAGGVVALLLPAGLLFLSHGVEGADATDWQRPWVFCVVSAALGAITTGATSALEGLGHVLPMSRTRALAGIARLVVLCLVLAAGGGLWSTGAASLAGAGVALLGLLPHRREIQETLGLGRRSTVSWRRDLWPFQWRIGLSWASGFFIFNILTISVAYAQGAAAAGRFGIAVSLANGVGAIASAWTTPRQAPWAALAARREWRLLDREFVQTTIAATLISLLGIGAGSVMLGLLSQHPIAWRLPEPVVWLLIGAAAVVNQPVFAAATYLRAHGREPFLAISILFGIGMGALAFPAAARGAATLAAVHLILNLGIGLGAGALIFCRCRTTWHAHPA